MKNPDCPLHGALHDGELYMEHGDIAGRSRCHSSVMTAAQLRRDLEMGEGVEESMRGLVHAKMRRCSLFERLA